MRRCVLRVSCPVLFALSACSKLGAGTAMYSGAPGFAAPVATAAFKDEFDTEAYDHVPENQFVAVADDPRSTFSIDVDTASYSNIRRFLSVGELPPADAVRIEEMINYFDYDYPNPGDGQPFSIVSEVGDCPWAPSHRLVHIGLEGKAIAEQDVPARNLVFLLDVSGSMAAPNKLPLLVRSLGMLTDTLRAKDRVAIAVYAGSSGLVLPSTDGAHRDAIMTALTQLEAGGSTNGGDGIELAYRIAEQNFIRGGINRVILATDGDFNVGVTSEGALVRLIENKRKSGVFLSVLGFGEGNLNDSTMEKLADKGNGNYAYIDSLIEARKVLVTEAGSTLVTIAKDVKIQVEFNPAQVEAFRLIGYENRVMAHSDFNDDSKDAGEIGAGHTVTALYEVVPAGSGEFSDKVDPLKYGHAIQASPASASGELMTVKIRYKDPDGDTSQLSELAIGAATQPVGRASADFRFAAAVAELGLLLRGSKFSGAANLDQIEELAQHAVGEDPTGSRREFLALVSRVRKLTGDPR